VLTVDLQGRHLLNIAQGLSVFQGQILFIFKTN